MRIPPIQLLMAHIVETPGPMHTPCWVPTYVKDKQGYAYMRAGERTRPCHAVAYEGLVAPIPDGLVIDHLCRVTGCCNPDHLEPVTRRTNILRGMSASAVAHRTNACHKGHSLENAPVDSGGRRCRTCANANKRRYAAIKKATLKAVA